MSILTDIGVAVESGQRKQVTKLVQQAIDEGIPPQQILSEGMLPGIDRLGVRFRNNEVFVPEVLVAARAMNAGTALLKPLLAETGGGTRGKAIIGTVKGDMHDIGKNLVRMMIEGKGIEVIDLGVDVPTETFVQAAAEHNADIVCCSSLLTTTMPAIGDVVEAFKAAGTRDKVKIMTGGAPVTQEFSDSVGADYYTVDAASAAICAAEIIAAKYNQ